MGATPIRRAYAAYEQDMGLRRIAGAVLRGKADLSHPLMFGYTRDVVPLLYNGRKPLAFPPIAYDMPYNYVDKNLLVTGFADGKELDKLAATPAMALHRMGQGKIVLFSHAPNFRAIWIGTERTYANALFFTQAIDYRKN